MISYTMPSAPLGLKCHSIQNITTQNNVNIFEETVSCISDDVFDKLFELVGYQSKTPKNTTKRRVRKFRNNRTK